MAAALLFIAAQRHTFAGSATWSTNPVSGDWNTATNWAPNTVPNGAGDAASFSTSRVRQIFVIGLIEVASLNFTSDAGAFTITTPPGTFGTFLSITGSGITNASGQVQTFITEFDDTFTSGFFFENSATAGAMTSFVGVGGLFFFHDSSSAGSASFDVSTGSLVGEVSFSDSSSAANSTINASDEANVFFSETATAAEAMISATSGSDVVFGSASTAGNVVFTGSSAGFVGFTQSARADHGHFTANGAETSSDLGAIINFYDDSSAEEATFVVNGGVASGAPGAVMSVFGRANAANANITVEGGSGGGDGGILSFAGTGLGGSASISVFGNGELDIADRAAPGVTIGSLAGDGRVFLGANKLTIGSNNQSTTFLGVIQESGAVAKIGTGTLTLSGPNTYTGTTTVSGGVLKAFNRNGSATGTGAVNVNAGTLGGKGTITGPTTIGTGSGAGAFLAPSVGSNKPATLRLQGLLAFKADGTYTYNLDTRKAKADQVVANGVTIQSGAQFDFNAVANRRLQRDQIFVAISNTSASPISGTFGNLADGSTLTAGHNKFQVSYSGGDGNDLTLTVVR